jgi:sporulation protein YlmC with PRC-barrel domain
MTDANRAISTDETDRLIASNKVEGTAVYDPNGDKLGSIYNFMVEKRSGQVEYAVLQFGGILGLGSDYYPLPWSKLTYDTDQGGYVVDIDKETLERAPHYRDVEPRYDRAYGAEVFGYYGVPYV